MSTPLNVFPAEVWLRIIRLACADTSFTARTLSLVSIDIYHLSKPYRLQSVSLLGVRRIFCFYRTLTSIPQTSRRVFHLFIGCSDLRVELEKLRDDFELHSIAQELYSTANLPLPNILDQDVFSLCIQQTLSLVADTLKNLHFHLTGSSSVDILPDHLPLLENLVLYGMRSPDQIKRNIPPKLPSLTHLRVGHYVVDPSNIIATISAHFPTLVRLTLVQPMISSDHFSDVLQMVKTIDTTWPERAIPVRASKKLVLEVDRTDRLTGPASNWYQQLTTLAATTDRVEVVVRQPGWTDVQKAESNWVLEARNWIEKDWLLDG